VNVQKEGVGDRDKPGHDDDGFRLFLAVICVVQATAQFSFQEFVQGSCFVFETTA
jgi:hypothetical protein